MADEFEIFPIGEVIRTSDGDGVYLNIFEPFRPGLKQLEHFSHVIVFWWSGADEDIHRQERDRIPLQLEPPSAPGNSVGLFATRAPNRPNPIAMTTCEIIAVDEKTGVVEIKNIDGFDGTGIIDLKTYFPVLDRVKTVKVPKWLSARPEWLPEEGIGLS